MPRDYEAHKAFAPEFLRAYPNLAAFALADMSFNPPDIWEAQVQEEKLGEIHLPTGQIIACDPAMASFQEYCTPFAEQVDSGIYPVYLGIPDKHTARRYAKNVFAVLHFSESYPAHWEMALTSQQKINTLSRYRYYGFGVDSGLGCFVDASFLALLKQFYERNPEGIKRDEINVISDSSEMDAAIFMTGMGDGSYPAFWGFDENHRPCRLLIDFQILRSPEEDRLREEYEEEYGE